MYTKEEKYMSQTTAKQSENTFYLGRFLLGITVVLCLFCVVFMRQIPLKHNVFTEFLVGELAMEGSNKTGEWQLFWMLLFTGCILMLGACLLEEFIFASRKRKAVACSKMLSIKKQYVMGIGVFFPVCMRAFIYHKISMKLVLASVVISLVVMFFTDAKEWLVLLGCIYFSFCSIATIASVMLRNYYLGDTKILLSTLIVFGGLAVSFKGKWHKSWKKKLCIVFQLPLPLLFLVYLKQDYWYQESVIRVAFSNRYRCVILASIVLLYISIWFQYIHKKYFFFASLISIYLFVSYMPTGQILPSDLHHHGEQIIGWQQVSDFGQALYKEYFPASGLFSLMTGFVNDIFFHNTATEYAMCFVLCGIIFAFVTMYLLYRRLYERALLVAILVPMPEYCRVWILLPVLLLLTDKKILEHKQIWILTWIGSVLVAGLYYPLFGVALLLATLPVGLLFFVQAMKEPINKKLLIVAAILFGVIAILSPLLFRMLSHVMSMAGQTLSVDGKAILGMELPKWFMPGFSDCQMKTVCYFTLRFMLGLVFVWAAVYFGIKYGILPVYRSLKTENNKLAIANILNVKIEPEVVAVIAVPIVLVVCYTYTMVCMDEDWVGNLLSRSDHVILSVCVSFGFVILYMLKDKIPQQVNALLIGVLCAIPFLFLITCEDYAFPYLDGRSDGESDFVLEYTTKIQPYDGLEGYIYIEDSLKEQYPYIDFELLGKGFAPAVVLEHLNKNAFVCETLKQFDPQMKLLGFEHTQFYYYLLHQPCVYSGRTAIAKSEKAFAKVEENLDPEHTIVRGSVDALDEYQLYLWCLENGYVYEENLNVYMPDSIYQKIKGRSGSLLNSPWAETICLGKMAGSFGASLEQMELVSSETKITVADNQQNSWVLQLDGTQEKNEFFNVKFAEANTNTVPKDTEVTLQIFTGIENLPVVEMECDYANGELLFPIGCNPACIHANIEKMIITVGAEDSITLQTCDLLQSSTN